jgi:Tol biopolymer transport system component
LIQFAVAAVAAAAAFAGCGGPADSLGDHSQIFVVDRTGGEPHRVTHDDREYTTPAWSPRGDRFAASFASGIAMFDRDGRLVKEFQIASVTGHDSVAWSRDGRRLAFEVDGGLVTLDVASGKRRTLANGALDTPAWTAHDRALVFLTRGGGLSTVPAGGGRPRRVGRGAAQDFPPQISRDGRRLLFSRPHGIWVARPDGAGQRRLGNRRDSPDAAWAPNDRHVVAIDYWRGNVRALVLSPKGVRRELRGIFAPEELDWSPDGRLIAWIDEPGDGGSIIKAVRPDGSGGHALVQMADGVSADGMSWSPDARRLAFTASKPPPD